MVKEELCTGEAYKESWEITGLAKREARLHDCWHHAVVRNGKPTDEFILVAAKDTTCFPPSFRPASNFQEQLSLYVEAKSI